MSFDRAVTLVLEHEGGYSNDPHDPGGETKYGIARRSYPELDIASLTESDARAIYRADYWNAVKGDQLPEPVAFVLFDTAVNMGVTTAIRLLQRALRIKQDGILGPVTILAAKNDPLKTARDLTTERILAYAGIRNFDRYGRGWISRSIATALAASA